MKPALLLLALATATALFAQEKPAEKRELLSSHQTTATFSGIEKRKCRGRTSACPYRCGDSGDYASFKIIEYIDYKKPGKYGDPKQTTFSVQIQDNMENQKVSPEILKAIKALKVGDIAHLNWNHDYVTKGGTSSPERTIQLIKHVNTER
ncbi:MAG: hypothetical protein OSA84_02445 [Akkermansiaceae bacterium]|nr:hypothetical protein [Akkermansiaceae bacterium]